jgi:hypothetical protein
MKSRKLLAAGIIAATALLAGCVVAPMAGPDYYERVIVAPPPPYVEYPGPPPVASYVWIGGYWNWAGSRHVWVPGRWEAPRSGYRWAPHRWERHHDHWRQYGGRWERDGRRGW